MRDNLLSRSCNKRISTGSGASGASGSAVAAEESVMVGKDLGGSGDVRCFGADEALAYAPPTMDSRISCPRVPPVLACVCAVPIKPLFYS